MKTFEKNQNPQDTNQSNQKNQTPGAGTQDPTKRPLDPEKNPVKEPGKQTPFVDPDPTSPEKHRIDPVATDKTDKGHSEKTENSADIRKNESDIDVNPKGETQNNPVDTNNPSNQGTQSNKDRNTNSGDIDREDQQR